MACLGPLDLDLDLRGIKSTKNFSILKILGFEITSKINRFEIS